MWGKPLYIPLKAQTSARLPAPTKGDTNSPFPLLQARRGTAVFHNEQEWGPEALWWMCCRRQVAERRVSKLRKCSCHFLIFISQLITNVLNLKSKRCLFLPLNCRVSQVNKPAFQGYNYIY